MKHKKLALTFSICIFVAILMISTWLICTVREVVVDYSFSTEKTEEEILQINDDLSKYIGKNVFSVKADDVAMTLSDNPYIKVVDVKVALPFKVRVEVEERIESFCVQGEDGFYVISEEGYVLAKGERNESRADGKPHVLVKGDVPAFTVNTMAVDDNGLYSVAVAIINSFEDKRNQISSIEIDRYYEAPSDEQYDWKNTITVKTIEGAVFEISQALECSEQKVELLKNIFNSLVGEDRVNRTVEIFTGENNTADYE